MGSSQHLAVARRSKDLHHFLYKQSVENLKQGLDLHDLRQVRFTTASLRSPWNRQKDALFSSAHAGQRTRPAFARKLIYLPTQMVRGQQTNMLYIRQCDSVRVCPTCQKCKVRTRFPGRAQFQSFYLYVFHERVNSGLAQLPPLSKPDMFLGLFLLVLWNSKSSKPN